MKKLVFMVVLVLLAVIFLGSIPLWAKDLVYGYVTPGPDTWYRKDVEVSHMVQNLLELRL